MATLSKGWGFPLLAKKGHYFAEGEAISLCGKWMYTGEREPSLTWVTSQCQQCRKRLKKAEEDAR